MEPVGVKTEPADENGVYSLEEETIVKDEMDIEPTRIQPPDIVYVQLPYKCEPIVDTAAVDAGFPEPPEDVASEEIDFGEQTDKFDSEDDDALDADELDSGEDDALDADEFDSEDDDALDADEFDPEDDDALDADEFDSEDDDALETYEVMGPHTWGSSSYITQILDDGSLLDEHGRVQPPCPGEGFLEGLFGNNTWTKGDRLNQVFPTDDDIPSRLRQEGMKRDEASNVVGENGGEHIRNVDQAIEDLMNEYLSFCKGDGGKFEWKPLNTFRGQREPFQVRKIGPTEAYATGYKAFRAYWDDEILVYIAKATNAHAADVSKKNEQFRASWYDTNAHEIIMLFSFWIILSIINKNTIDLGFLSDRVCKIEALRSMFTRERYWALNLVLRTTLEPYNREDPDELHLIRPVVDHLNKKFKECYVLSEDVWVGDSSELWRGSVSFRQYLTTKAKKFGINIYELCESVTGYLWSFFIYTEKSSETESSALLKRVRTVLTLISPLLRKGYRVFVNNWFGSPKLARFLKLKQTDCVGTLNRNCEDIPPLLSAAHLRKGSYIARHADDVMLVAHQESKQQIMVSTHHRHSQRQIRVKRSRLTEYKLDVVCDYNKGTSGFQKKNYLHETSLVESNRRHSKWFLEVIKRLLEDSILNSRIIMENDLGYKMDPLKYKFELVCEMMANHLHLVPKRTRSHPRQKQTIATKDGLNPERIVCKPGQFHSLRRHELDVQGKKHTKEMVNASNKVLCQGCWLFDHKRKATVFECSLCRVPLCREPCFEKYHTTA